MNKWEHVRRAARTFREEICALRDVAAGSIGTDELVRLAVGKLGLQLRGVAPGHPDLPEGVDARLDDVTVYYRNDVEAWLAFYYQLHEIAHVALGHGSRDCSAADINPEASETKQPFGVHRVQGYGPQERIECEANIFAREFLLPRNVLAQWAINDGLNATQISEKSGVGIEMVLHQLAFALLTPEIPERPAHEDDEKTLTLNESQGEAARVPGGPQLIDAGPGTGKTRTLVGRVLHLLDRGVAPENILVLTFSNKAAEELRTRVHRFAPGAAADLTVETFHSFGIELLRKHGTKIGLPANPEVVDPVEAVFMLERALPDLDLDHYRYLPEPARDLPDIARAISRAKDENVAPDRYLDLAQAQRGTAGDNGDAIERAEKALEVARAYHIYERELAERKAVDLGDLICKSITVLTGHEDVRAAVRERYRHVLVDEYQDVNRASGLLLKLIVGDGRNLWAVGDLRQSIHRWRGATTANIRQFKNDFPLAKEPISLAKNYRSQRSIVELFAAFAAKMKTSRDGADGAWEIHNEDEGPSIRFAAAADPESEALGIAREIEELHRSGVAYRDQAVICRTHTGLARVAKVLAAVGVPVLYMGDLFERPEVRDMLALLSLAAGQASGIVRVARFAEYSVPYGDIQALIAGSRERSIPFPAALTRASEIEGISAEGVEKMSTIARHLEDLTHGRSAWKCLTRYLFERSRYLKSLVADATATGQQRRLALYQLLQFVHSRREAEPEGGADPKADLLRYIRRLEVLGDEKQLREPDEWASAIDAVRVMTVHASKGLEFRAVFLPGLFKGGFPLSNSNRDKCPPPEGLSSETDPEWTKEEEECLFFVAMSRARERLYLSRPLKKGGKNSSPSEFLATLSDVLPAIDSAEATWADAPEADATAGFVLPPLIANGAFRPDQLDLYEKCPLSYFYRYVLGLSGRRDDTAYQQFHRAVYRTVDKLKADREGGTEITDDVAMAALEKEWAEEGPTDHHLAELYKSSAEEMVANAAEHMRASAGRLVTEHELRLAGGSVKLEFDLAAMGNGGDGPLVIQRFRTGRPSASEANKDVYALLKTAAKNLGGTDARVETLYLRDRTAIPVTMSDKVVKNRIEKYEKSIRAIADGQFHPKENDRECPRCPHYFICPAAV